VAFCWLHSINCSYFIFPENSFQKKSPENAVSISANFRIHLVLLKWFNLVFCSPDANGSYHALASQGTGSLVLLLQANASALRFLQEKMDVSYSFEKL